MMCDVDWDVMGKYDMKLDDVMLDDVEVCDVKMEMVLLLMMF